MNSHRNHKLEPHESFVIRHVGPSESEIEHMLAEVGYSSLDDLIDAAVPGGIRSDAVRKLPEPTTELGALERLRARADRNVVATSLIGMGYYDTFTPSVIVRRLLESPAWYTAYTPYQPEISQGRLEALLNFQTMVSDLTAMDMANASLLDEGTAAAEAMTLARRVDKTKRNTFFVDSDCHPQTIDVIETRAKPLGIKVMTGNPFTDLDPAEVYACLIQFPGSSGEVPTVAALTKLTEAMHAEGAQVAVAADLLALTLLTPPGEWGADIVVGTSQRFGVPLGFGGPHAGYMAVRDRHKRAMPGRLVGVSIDDAGRPAMRLALQTREQHIRREKATSNICTAQVLLAVISAMYAIYHGPDGLRAIARRVHRLTSVLAHGLTESGYEVVNDNWFDTLTVRVPHRAQSITYAAYDLGLNLRKVDADTVGISLDETTTAEIVGKVWQAFDIDTAVADIADESSSGLPADSARNSEFLTHPVFHSYRSETDMLRYLRRLADKDVALDRAMIPLGSCTMKLNATTEMEPITWPEFGRMHPFVPMDQASGYLHMIRELESMLVDITGYDEVSLQPNAGSQGEYAGLLAIRRYHESRDDGARDVCLIPESAHGTNAASAVMAGLRVVVVNCDDFGNVDVDDLKAKLDDHRDTVAALMITYPSTHGVFEVAVREICQMTHDAGGQVYVDGANMNALVGVAPPGEWGGDVSHLNLHKTFCIPHGGGGPGVGPVAVKRHLAPFLPNHPVVSEAGPETGPGAISAAPWGSAGILPIPWMYITLMGGEGLAHATKVAILSANYIASRLSEAFPVLYSGPGGLVAHECIVDVRQHELVSNEDVAKRLIDYGFHAPTMSFPVPGTLMIEPTESESLIEIDRFCDAMIAIKAEIDKVESGVWPADDNPLVNSPHPAEDLLTDEWNHPYSRAEAAYPVESLRADKYWVPVSRVDNGHGDRNLICACPDPRAFEEV
ncbi:MAG: aminomethyl-transferring glycine dehydrogenase [Actinobacteria bacterium]|nr:aminomethyl-transferring glycine dehydrogenase [Actinomycetota bacterium]